jgi:hypothetical protein
MRNGAQPVVKAEKPPTRRETLTSLLAQKLAKLGAKAEKPLMRREPLTGLAAKKLVKLVAKAEKPLMRNKSGQNTLSLVTRHDMETFFPNRPHVSVTKVIM